jgi:glycyl-tRNA synthetase beta subunit
MFRLFKRGQRYLVIVDEHRKLFSYGITVANDEREAIEKVARQFNEPLENRAADVTVLPLKPGEDPDARFETEVANRSKV